MQLLKLVAEQIQIGAPLPFNVRDASGGLLLACGQIVISPAQLASLLTRGMYADAEELRALKAGSRVAAEPPPLAARWSQAVWSIDAMLKTMPDALRFMGSCDEAASEVIALALQDGDLAIYHAVRQENLQLRQYGLTHSLYVATLCLMVSRRLGWPEERQRKAVKAALTMNASIIELQGVYAISGVRLTQSQRELMRQHPEDAYRRLRAAGIQDEEWLQAVAQHHEQVGGKGYPKGQREVVELAQLLRLADVFLAKISARVNRPALDIKTAVRQVYEQAPGNAMVASLVKEFGMYPPGELLRLANGDLAVVIRRGASLQCPLVMALANAKGQINANPVRLDTSKREYAVVAVESDKSMLARMPSERLYGLYGMHGLDSLNPTH
ncbi:HD-GYP domain-containing protein [Roseateles oligotrophus]|uniref:Phosphohydrolase n=1 Tax=Roseateles oligotrophus TaxID=1769250 RepID=A0ABT2YCR8_9BURK|nr:HD domain-containing phosphohydrolase [Roseateles oligotrophus]MCV2367835.1 phosphohydrolase [Roseateles oligotrophus]